MRDQAKAVEQLLSYFPKNPWCPACQRATARRAKRRALGGHNIFGGAGLGHSAFVGHIIADSGGLNIGVGKRAKRVASCFKDLGTGFIDMVPCADKPVATTHEAINHFCGSAHRNYIYADGAKE